MLNKQQIIGEIIRLVTVKELVEAYEEIAATRMRRIRGAVLQRRDFLSGLTQIFQEVKTSYKNEILALMKRKKMKDTKKLSLIKRNGKTVAILLAANTGLYGDIVKKTYFLFNKYIKSTECDIVIIGRLGKSLFEEDKLGKQFTYYDFPDSGADNELLRKLMELVIQYEKILVFYGKFQNIVYQYPTMFDLYGSEETFTFTESSSLKYFFEPDLEKVMNFFEAQMFASIFEQTVRESDLAKFAARMFTLDKATENVKSRLKKVELERRIFQHRMLNKKQLDSLSGMSLWRHT